jgi:hypothetical protein
MTVKFNNNIIVPRNYSEWNFKTVKKIIEIRVKPNPD